MITKIKTVKRVVAKEKKSTRKIYSNKIRLILREMGMSQQELADKIEADPSHLHRIMSGKYQSVSLPMAMQIAAALNKKVEEVFQLTPDEKPVKKRANAA